MDRTEKAREGQGGTGGLKMIQEKGKRRAGRAPALLAAYLALALFAGCAGGAGSSAAEQNSASSSGAAESALSARCAAGDRFLRCVLLLPAVRTAGRMSRKRWGRGIFPAYRIARKGEQDPYLEPYATARLCSCAMCTQGMTTYLGTWSYESGVLTLTRPSAEETYVFFAQDADTLLMHSGDLVMAQPGAVLTRLAQ